MPQNETNERRESALPQDMTSGTVHFVPIGQVPGENILWHRDLTRGIIRKQVVVQERITNIRILRYNVEAQKLMSEISLRSYPDVVVENSRRRSQSYGSGLYGRGAYTGSRSGTSREIGDVLIMKDGTINTKLSNVVDPQGVKRIIDTLKREIAAAQKQVLPGHAPISVSPVVPAVNETTCRSCGAELPTGSNFCNKCGSIQT